MSGAPTSACTQCGKENQPHYKYCLGCGADLGGGSAVAPVAAATDGPRNCPSCGAAIPDAFAFCGQCGARLKKASAGQPEPKPVSRARLVLIRPDGSEGGAHPLEPGENMIGRGAGPLFDTDGYLSPRHAELVLGGGQLIVRDTASLNGVFVKLTEEQSLESGDIFRIGQELLRFDQTRPPAPLPDGTEIMGSPNPGYWGRLVLIVGPQQDGSAFPLFGDDIILGRERGDVVFPEDGYVSGTHARVSIRSGKFTIADLNSSNGTFLRVRRERVVPSGTLLLMGQQLFRASF